MKIQCNSCTKTYLVSPKQIGESGRRVKCMSCNHTWHEALSSATNVKEVSGRNFVQNLVFTTLTFTVVAGLCVVIAFPKEMSRVYKTYKNSISYKLGHKKEQLSDSDVKRFAVDKSYQDYLFLSNFSSS